MNLRAFQRRFLAGALAPGVRTSALSLPRANGKTTLASMLAYRVVNPRSSLFRRGTESHLVSSSLGQSRRTAFRLLKARVEARPDCDSYRVSENRNECAVTHLPTDTRISVLAPKAATAQGLVGCPWVIGDEPGSWDVLGGFAMHEAIQTAQGKPQSPLHVLYIGTLAPQKGDWWPSLVKRGSSDSRFVACLQADPKRWDDVEEIRRVNPLAWQYPESRAVLLDELEDATRDEASKATFLSYRLNLPARNEQEVLLTVEDWQRVIERPVPERDGRAVVGLDFGSSRAWSSATAIYENGRCEAIAVAPGVPSIADQEKRDRVPPATYARLLERGQLHVDADRRVPRVSKLLDKVWEFNPAVLIVDRFRIGEVLDAVRGRCRVVPRVWQWSSASEDIRHLRRLCADGPLAVDEASRGLLAVSLAAAKVVNDSSGNMRLVKRGTNNSARDDVAVSLTLAAAEAFRQGCGVEQDDDEDDDEATA